LSYKVAIVADDETVAGFALAGVSETYVHVKKEETLAKLDELFAGDEVGVVFITYRVAEALEPEFKRKMRAKRLLPVVLRVPDKSGWVPRVDELQEIIRRTVGAEITVKGGS